MCDCCGCFTQNKTLCVQCLHAGCDQKKPGERCYLAQGAMHPKAHSLPPAPDETPAYGGKIEMTKEAA